MAREKDGTPTACNPIPYNRRHQRRSKTRYVRPWGLVDLPDNLICFALFLDVYRQEAVYLLAKYVSESQLKTLLQHLGYREESNILYFL